MWRREVRSTASFWERDFYFILICLVFLFYVSQFSIWVSQFIRNLLVFGDGIDSYEERHWGFLKTDGWGVGTLTMVEVTLTDLIDN